MATIEQFAESMRRYAGQIEKNAPRVQREVAAAVLQAVIVSTPVGNPTLWKGPHPKGYVGGRARANWLVGVGSAPTGEVDVGHDAMTAGEAVIASAAGTRADIHITNNVPYIVPLNEGHSHQAPAAFVETAIANGVAKAKESKVLE